MTVPLQNQTGLPASEPDRRSEIQHSALLRRVWMFSVSAYAIAALGYIVGEKWESLLGFTCSAALVMINFRWLEQIVGQIVQPAPRRNAWRLAMGALARFALFGAVLSIAIYVARFDALSVLLGFSVLVAGILSEAVYSAFRPLKS